MKYELKVGLDCPSTSTGYLEVCEDIEASGKSEAVQRARAKVPAIAMGWPLYHCQLYDCDGRLVTNFMPVTLGDLAETFGHGAKKFWQIFWHGQLGLCGPVGALGGIVALRIVNGHWLPVGQAWTLIVIGFAFTALLSLSTFPISFALLFRSRRSL